MLIVYDSKTGNVARFIDKLNLRCVKLDESMTVDEPFVLVTYTTGFGQPPASVLAFLIRNHGRLTGVSASGNRNWGDNFARSADHIARLYGVPVISKFEMSGTARDVDQFVKEMDAIAVH
ncbi:class Ib ribonucleoside-diphosphate reductase assembly flavoprotein NrdI [Paenibacillus sp. IB182496]|uniref:Class Ib ribonucleoside-diphosphate reductase assembly flavoprotein NrdI n=1 Tax=Paenibacillus sabuli TaxID=2772509 RepID=A0A927GTT2_9BACL|nr:class Ib ribonucleoside-diphosphate reductase assembly flavoprotein NrdI [Paenibacillus sabuli]MBD2847022.1 class Ib ribonucleoside-diphosphate reductase assembly flavoprotein NrdI [Paenibacillus sabuli]